MPLGLNNNVEWDFIIDTIKSEKCVLMIGPDVARMPSGETVQQALWNHLRQFKDDDSIIYYNDDEFMLFKNESDKLVTYFEIQKFYDKIPVHPIYEKIAQIPFDLILSVSPDTFLKQVYDKYQIGCAFETYKKYENPGKINRPSKDVPLVYNLFGTVEDDESLIFTHDDLFDYLFSILGSKKLPVELEHEVKSARNIIFLGFKFDRWYVKLLLRLFNLHQGRFLRYASGQISQMREETLEFYKYHFKVNFIDSDIDEFITTIHRLCEENGILRVMEPGKELSLVEKVRQAVLNESFDQAFELLMSHLQEENEELYNEVVVLSGSFKRVQRRIDSKTITEDEANVRINQTKFTLLDLLEEIKK